MRFRHLATILAGTTALIGCQQKVGGKLNVRLHRPIIEYLNLNVTFA
jgi:hypothetical protein